MPIYSVRNIDVDFPHEAYAMQLAFMSHLVRALDLGENALLEAPTGSGKTLCLLCASLGWLKAHKAKHREKFLEGRQLAAAEAAGPAAGAPETQPSSAAATAAAATDAGASCGGQASAAAAVAASVAQRRRQRRPGHPLPAPRRRRRPRRPPRRRRSWSTRRASTSRRARTRRSRRWCAS